GAGRPAKLYRRSDVDVEVSLPERRYDLAGRLLVRAVAEVERTEFAVADAVRDVAHKAGRELGVDAVATVGRRQRRQPPLDTVVGVLVALGFEPRVERDDITLANCPFDALAQEETELMCGMNLD